MNRDRYQQVMQLVDQLLDRPVEERSAVLDEVCNGDGSLRREVEQILTQQLSVTGFLEHSPLDALSDLTVDPLIGSRVGSYRIIEAIGRGGMGAVYKAARDDAEYKTQVAIKLIKRGMDTDYILRRFRHERQILANLNHPNIARLLDGGTTADGLPYFVMEYVEGLPIDDYCAAHKSSIKERLVLFQRACSAVQYAHQNLVIHRDLKPSNILVTGKGVPKLLDFGIAKLLQADADESAPALTATELRVMTTHYASPEQIKGEQVTTATDVYSLGVVLYELLTGRRPYRFKSHNPGAVARVICEQEPERPSKAATGEVSAAGASGLSKPENNSQNRLSRGSKNANRRTHAAGSELRGDIDAIVLMALRKEPERRYASVEQFSEDVRRYLAKLPVRARKNAATYRAAKFLKRHQVGATVTVLLLITLLAGMVATIWQSRVARAERARAERRFNEVRRLANAALFDYHDAIASLPGSTPVRERLVKDALEYLDSLAQDAGDDSSLRQELATAYIRVGDVQGRPYRSNLGQTDGALASYRKALQILEPLSASDPANLEVKRSLATAYERVGNIQWRKGDFADALQKNEKALTLRQGLFAADPSNITYRRELADSYIYVGDVLPVNCQKVERSVECYESILESHRKALEIREALAKGSPADAELRRDLAQAYMRVGFGLTHNADAKPEYLRQALESHGKALVIREELALANPDNARDRRNLADQYMLRSDSQVLNGYVSDSLVGYRKALAIFKELSVADSSNAEARLDLSFALTKLAAAEAMAGNVGAAKKNYAEALPVLERLLAVDPNVEVMQVTASVHVRLSELSEKAGDLSGAIENYDKAVDITERFGAVNSFPTLPSDLAMHYHRMGGLYAKSANRAPNSQRAEKWHAAKLWFQKSLDIYLDLKSKHALGSADANKPAEIAREIDKCEAALKKR